MKKTLMMVLILLVIALVAYTAVNGFSIGNIEILSLEGIKLENDELDAKIAEATRLAQVDFINKKSEVLASSRQLEEAKTTYDDMVTVSSSEDVALASQLVGYKIEYLWATIGTHATREGVVIKLDIVNGTGGDKVYNLNFTVTGSYVGITDFISDIEDDSNLGFKIEEFSMKPATVGTTNETEETEESEDEELEQKEGNDDVVLSANFTCKNVKIEDVSQTTQIQPENDQNAGTEGQENSTTDTTNSTSNTDATDETNTTNNTSTTSDANTTNNTSTANDTNTTNGTTTGNTTNTTNTTSTDI